MEPQVNPADFEVQDSVGQEDCPGTSCQNPRDLVPREIPEKAYAFVGPDGPTDDDVPLACPGFVGRCPGPQQWEAIQNLARAVFWRHRVVIDGILASIGSMNPEAWTRFVIALFDQIPEEAFVVMDFGDLFGDFTNYYSPGAAVLALAEAARLRGDDDGDGERSNAVPYRFVFENRLELCAEITPLADVTA